MFYILLHAVAAYHNEPIGEARPPEKKTHACCVIIARLALVSWLVAIIASAVVVGKPLICVKGSKDCRLQVLDLVASNLAL